MLDPEDSTPADGWESHRPLDSLGFVGIWGPPADPWQGKKVKGEDFFKWQIWIFLDVKVESDDEKQM